MHWRGLIFISAAITHLCSVRGRSWPCPVDVPCRVAVSMFADDHARPMTVLIYTVVGDACWAGSCFLSALELPIPAFWR